MAGEILHAIAFTFYPKGQHGKNPGAELGLVCVAKKSRAIYFNQASIGRLGGIIIRLLLNSISDHLILGQDPGFWWANVPLTINSQCIEAWSAVARLSDTTQIPFYQRVFNSTVGRRCSNPRYLWVTYFILSNICYFSQLVLSILSTHPLFALSIFVTLSIFRRLIKFLSSSRPLLSIHFLRYLLIL